MKLSLKSLVLAGALSKAAVFLFVALMNLLAPPYGGAYLAMMPSVYPGYDPMSGPIGIILGTLYSLLAGALAGLLFGGLYNCIAEKS
jgi:hypothetical protein